MVRFIAVDDNGKITGTVAKPAIEAVAKPLVDAAEARLTPKPVLKTVSQQAATANGAADGPTGIMMRMIVTIAPTVKRWRVRIRNAGASAQGSGTLNSPGIYHAVTPTTNPGILNTNATRVVTDFSVVGATEFVSPWVDAATAPLGNGVSYSVGFNVQGATSTVMGDALIPIYTSDPSFSAQSRSVNPTLSSRVPFAVTIEYEAEFSVGAISQGGMVEMTREEWMAAKQSGGLDPRVFYAVTEAI